MYLLAPYDIRFGDEGDEGWEGQTAHCAGEDEAAAFVKVLLRSGLTPVRITLSMPKATASDVVARKERGADEP